METSTSAPSHIGLETRIVCRVCQKQFSKYTCPRCNLRYCSLACYKAHSLRCTESFMRENVLEEMREIQATDELKGKTMEMLKRFHFDEAGRSILEDESFPTDEDDCDGSEGTIFAETTVQRILEGAVPTLDELTEEERKRFMRSLAAGEVSHLIHPWSPWWLNPSAKSVTVTRQGTGLVQPLDSSPVQISSQPGTSNQMEVDSSSEVPAPPSKPLVPVRELTQKEPSPLLPVHLAEVIYAYCFTLRYYNGDWHSEPLEATSACFSVSHVLGRAALPEYVGEALSGALQTVCSPMFKDAGGLSFGLAVYDDCVALLRLGRACIICALADLHGMLENAKADLDSDVGPTKREETGLIQELKSSGSPSAKLKTGRRKSVISDKVMGGKGSRNELKRIEAGIRKIFFMMCWANEQVDEVLSSLAVLVETEKARIGETLETPDTLGFRGMNNTKPVKERPFVQEMV